MEEADECSPERPGSRSEFSEAGRRWGYKAFTRTVTSVTDSAIKPLRGLRRLVPRCSGSTLVERLSGWKCAARELTREVTSVLAAYAIFLEQSQQSHDLILAKTHQGYKTLKTAFWAREATSLNTRNRALSGMKRSVARPWDLNRISDSSFIGFLPSNHTSGSVMASGRKELKSQRVRTKLQNASRCAADCRKREQMDRHSATAP